ncbi:Sterile alpha motif domain-containing protein 5 [Melipona quadrifasciata]|uniref:Sterile alpha motif domain-containing protein 5 n=1 Tax=Melipona quadrifasciata TaxID=166423 RepID=A0A0M9A328_9HYME|nr:Sterile alpha motif domain-containing protein 5 [Melipona quadrifasciata]
MTMASNIVVEWLRSLHLGQYSESFIDNGYDDLEICKQIGDPDLDAIGVFNQTHRARLLQSVKTLREEGAASVYFTLEESNDCLCDNVSSKSSRTSSERPLSDKEAQRASPTASSSSGGQELTKFADEYEEGKAELVRIPRMQLRMLLQEKLRHDGIRLACQPYTTPQSLTLHRRIAKASSVCLSNCNNQSIAIISAVNLDFDATSKYLLKEALASIPPEEEKCLSQGVKFMSKTLKGEEYDLQKDLDLKCKVSSVILFAQTSLLKTQHIFSAYYVPKGRKEKKKKMQNLKQRRYLIKKQTKSQRFNVLTPKPSRWFLLDILGVPHK